MTDAGIAWLDVETTGIKAEEENLLQVACIVTDLDLNILDAGGFNKYVYYPEAVVEILKTRTNPYVLDMHMKTGLWDSLPDGTPLSAIDEDLLSYIKSFFPDMRTAWLGGNSITLDRNFINLFLPKVGEHLHYRSVDVTSWAGPAQWWRKGLQYHKKTLHDAFSDITESIDELKFLRDNFIAPQGIPDLNYTPEVNGTDIRIADWNFDIRDEEDGAKGLGVSPAEYAEHNARVFAELAKVLREKEKLGSTVND